MFHFELRKFPHSVSRFNQTEQQMLSLAVPWTREQWVEVGERKWNVNETRLTVLEGPELSLQEMSMNRGWRNARRRSEDVTERVLAAARTAGAGRSSAPPSAHAPAGPPTGGTLVGTGGAPVAADLDLLADSLALEILGALDDGPAPLPRVWRLAHERLAGRPASESLALAERAVRSLLARGLVVLASDGAGRDARAGGVDPSAGAREAGKPRDTGELDAALTDVDSWVDAAGEAVAIARSA